MTRNRAHAQVFLRSGESAWTCLGPTSAADLLAILAEHGLQELPVIDARQSRVVGLLPRGGLEYIDAHSLRNRRRLTAEDVKPHLESHDARQLDDWQQAAWPVALIIGSAPSKRRNDRLIH